MSISITDELNDMDTTSTIASSANLTTHLNDILDKQAVQLQQLNNSDHVSSPYTTTTNHNIVASITNTLAQSQQLSNQLHHELSRHTSSSSISSSHGAMNNNKSTVNTDYLMIGAIPKPRPTVRDSKYSPIISPGASQLKPRFSHDSTVTHVLDEWSKDKDMWHNRINKMQSTLQLNDTIQSPVKLPNSAVYRLENELSDAVDTIVQLKTNDNNKINELNTSINTIQHQNMLNNNMLQHEKQLLIDRVAKSESLNNQQQMDIHTLKSQLNQLQASHKSQSDYNTNVLRAEVESLKARLNDVTTQLNMERKLNIEHKNTIFQLQQQNAVQSNNTSAQSTNDTIINNLDQKYQLHIKQLQQTVDTLTQSLNDTQKRLYDESTANSITVTQYKHSAATLQNKLNELNIQCQRYQSRINELNQLQQQNSQLQADKMELNLRVDQLQYEVSHLKIVQTTPNYQSQHELDKLQHTIESLKLDIINLQQQLQSTETDKLQLQQRVDELQYELNRIRTNSTYSQSFMKSPEQQTLQNTTRTGDNNRTNKQYDIDEYEHKSNSPSSNAHKHNNNNISAKYAIQTASTSNTSEREAVLEQLLEKLVRNVSNNKHNTNANKHTQQYTDHTDNESSIQQPTRSRSRQHTRPTSTSIDDKLQLNVHVNLDESALNELNRLQQHSLTGTAQISLSPPPHQQSQPRPHTSKSTRRSMNRSQSNNIIHDINKQSRNHSLTRLSSHHTCQCGCTDTDNQHYLRQTKASTSRNKSITQRYANPCKKCQAEPLKTFSNYSHWTNQ